MVNVKHKVNVNVADKSSGKKAGEKRRLLIPETALHLSFGKHIEVIVLAHGDMTELEGGERNDR